MTVLEFKDNISAMLHGGSLKKVRNFESLMERAANVMLSKIDPVDTMRTASLASTIHDDIYNYSLPSDCKKVLDIYPQDNRELSDTTNRSGAERFDLRKSLNEKRFSIESDGGDKFIRINWRSRQGVAINEANTLTANGTWTAVGTATSLKADDIDYVSGSGSIRFDVLASGDGIQNTTMSAVDLTDEDEVSDFFLYFKIKDSTDLAKLTSVSCLWGNDLSTNYWTGVAQTQQADGTAFKVGWNLIKIPWSTAIETGTVNPATVDSFKITFATTGAITNLRIDNILCSIGRNFDMKYYSKFLIKNSSGTWISKTTNDSDIIVLDNDAIAIYQFECLKMAAHQAEGEDSSFDIKYADMELETLYKKYKVEHPTQAKKLISSYGSSPARGRW